MAAFRRSRVLAIVVVLTGVPACGGSDANRIVRVDGRPIAVRVEADGSLEAKLSASADDAVTNGLRRALNDLRQQFPAVYARQVPRIEQVVLRDPTPDNRRGLTIALLKPAARLPCPDGVDAALEADYRSAMDRVFAGRSPELVTSSEAADYFDWVRLQDKSAALIVSDVARFSMSPAPEHPEVARRVRSWLLDKATDLARRGVCSSAVPAALQAERQTYVAWLGAAAHSMTVEERDALALALFQAPRCPCASPDDSYGYARPDTSSPCTSWRFDGFDVFAFGLASLDAWLARARRNAGDASYDRYLTAWLQSALAHESDRVRLASALCQRDDAFLAGLFSFSAIDSATVPVLYRALEACPRGLQVARERFH